MQLAPTQDGCETHEDLHRLGVRIAVHHLRRKGIVPVSVTGDERYDPQIIARRGDERLHYAVRTAWLPDVGMLECDELREELLAWARQDNALCYLASVGIDPGMVPHEHGLPHHRLVIRPLDGAAR